MARKAWVFLLALGLFLVPATAATAATAAASSDAILQPEFGWHGRAIQAPHTHRHNMKLTSTARSLRGWSAGPAAFGTGTKTPSGSLRVREVQRRLTRLGYDSGPVDGVYGPRTQAAVAWFQLKHGLPANGRATLATVGHLRERTGTSSARPPRADRSAGIEAAPRVQAPAPAAAATDEALPSWLKYAGLTYLLFHLVGFGYFIGRRWSRRRPAPRPEPSRETGSPRAVGYVRLAPGARSASFHAQAAAIETGCLARGLTLVSLVSDVEQDAKTPHNPMPALADALARLQSGEADRLVVSRLDHLARTRNELATLLNTIGRRNAALVVLDRNVDTARLPDPVQPDQILRRPAHRTGSLRPVGTRAIDSHIASMLNEGLSPEEIATALNHEPVPPPEGVQWEFQGIEAALRRGGHVQSKERSDV
jgi:peptidoglycan hydrolase-like protein with peptidoglycan-binding domain